MTIHDIPDAVLMVLAEVAAGVPLDVADGELVLLCGSGPLPVPQPVLDALELFGWAVVCARGVVPTRNGLAAVKEWRKKRVRGRAR